MNVHKCALYLGYSELLNQRELSLVVTNELHRSRFCVKPCGELHYSLVMQHAPVDDFNDIKRITSVDVVA